MKKTFTIEKSDIGRYDIKNNGFTDMELLGLLRYAEKNLWFVMKQNNDTLEKVKVNVKNTKNKK